jgi:hypothetical protein
VARNTQKAHTRRIKKCVKIAGTNILGNIELKFHPPNIIYVKLKKPALDVENGNL